MKTPTDVEIAQQLEQLAQVIETGLNSANQVLVKVESIRAEINQDTESFTNIKSEVLAVFNEAKATSTDIHRLQLESQSNLDAAKQINQDVETHVKQIHSYEELISQVCQEIANVRVSLETAQNQLEKFEQQIPELNQKLPQHLDEIEKIATQIHHEQNHLHQLIQTSQSQIQAASQTNIQSQQMINSIESIFTQFGGKQGFEQLQQKYANTHQHLQQAELEIERLRIKLETQIKKQNLLQPWLMIVSLGVIISMALALFK